MIFQDSDWMNIFFALSMFYLGKYACRDIGFLRYKRMSSWYRTLVCSMDSWTNVHDLFQLYIGFGSNMEFFFKSLVFFFFTCVVAILICAWMKNFHLLFCSCAHHSPKWVKIIKTTLGISINSCNYHRWKGISNVFT